MEDSRKTNARVSTRYTPDQIIEAVELFAKQNDRFPQTLKGEEDTYEYRVRIKYNNLVRKKKLPIIRNDNPALYDRIMKLESIKSTRSWSDAERIEQFETFYKKNGRKPVATRGQVSDEEYNLARSYDIDFCCGGKRRISLSPYLEKRLSDLEKEPGWKVKLPPNELIAKLVIFCDTKHWFPQRNAPDCQERSLAQGVAQKNRFTEEQNATIKNLREKYGRNERVSYPEKIFYQALQEILGDCVTANRKICGHEADISFPYKGQYYIIQYDGVYYHLNDKNERNDRAANAAHIAAKNKVIRIREKGLLTLNFGEQYNESEYKEISVDPNSFAQEDVEKILLLIFDFIDYHNGFSLSAIWDDLIKKARYESSSRKTAVMAVCEYLEHILLTETVPSRSSQRDNDAGTLLDMRIKSLYNRNCFREIDLEALALLEAFYEPGRRNRNQKKYESIGKPFDFDKGSQYVSPK